MWVDFGIICVGRLRAHSNWQCANWTRRALFGGEQTTQFFRVPERSTERAEEIIPKNLPKRSQAVTKAYYSLFFVGGSMIADRDFVNSAAELSYFRRHFDLRPKSARRDGSGLDDFPAKGFIPGLDIGHVDVREQVQNECRQTLACGNCLPRDSAAVSSIEQSSIMTISSGRVRDERELLYSARKRAFLAVRRHNDWQRRGSFTFGRKRQFGNQYTRILVTPWTDFAYLMKRPSAICGPWQSQPGRQNNQRAGTGTAREAAGNGV